MELSRSDASNSSIKNKQRANEERLRRQRAAIAALVVDEAIAAGDMQAALKRLTRKLSEAIGVARASVWLISEDGLDLRCISFYDTVKNEYSNGTVLKTAEFPRYFAAIRAESRINAQDAQTDPKTSELTEGYLVPLGITSMLDAGIQIDGKLAGVVCLEHVGAKRKWHPDEELFVSTAAAMAAQLFTSVERKRAEEALRVSEERYRQLVELSPDGIAVYQDGNFVYVNPAGLRMVGAANSHELIGKPILSIIHPDSREEVIRRMGLVAQGTAVPPLEEKLIRLDGGVLYAEVVALATTFNNKPAGQVIVRDITERKRVDLERQVIFEISQAINITKNIDELLIEVHQSINKILFAENCFVVLYNKDLSVFEKAFFIDQVDPPFSTTRLGKSCTAYVFRTGKPLLLSIEEFNALVRSGEVELVGTDAPSWLGVPLNTSKETIGVVVVQHYEKKDVYSQRDLEFLSSVGNQIATAIDRKRVEEQYTKLVETMSDGVYKTTRNGRFIEANPALVRILGFDSKEELLAIEDITTQLYFSPTERESALIDEELHTMSVYRLKKKDGSEIWVEDHGREIVDNEGTVIYNEGVLRDITERIKSQQKLKESEEQFHSLFDNAYDPILLIDETFRFVDCNNATVKILCAESKSQLFLKHPAELSPERQPDGQLSIIKAEQMIANAHANGSTQFEWVHKRLDGMLLFMDVSLTVIPMKNKNVLLVHWRDITEQKKAVEALRESEKRLRMAQNVAHIGSWEYDIVHDTWWGSEECHRLYGITEGGDAVNVEYIAGQMPEIQMVTRAIADLINTGKKFDIEYSLIRKGDPHTVIVQSVGELITDDKGTPLKVVGTLQDITDRKILENQLIQSQKLEGLGTLAGGIAHDFNNLLAMMLGNAELLKMHVTNDSRLSAYVDRIIDVSHRGASISKQLLLFSRQTEVNLVPISLPQIIEEVKTMLQHFIPKSISVVTDIGEENGIINGDAGHIHQIILNLCINAKDAMGDHGTLTIKERMVNAAVIREKYSIDNEREYVAVAISDTGSGIDDRILPKIFDPFFTTKEKGKGTGLGLSIVDGIVRSHHGFIDVKSKKGEGTTFTLYFPTAAASDEELAAGEGLPSIAGKKVLVVDDEVNIRRILTEYLEEAGAVVLEASDGIEALDLYYRHIRTVDIVISDLGMPKMNGEELYRKLKEINPSAKVIISSGYLDQSKRSSMIESGIYDVISKPYKLSEVALILKRVLSAEK